ncbi:eukaryotic translation initiation factor 3 subunit L-like [Dendronephthya gigantea]|uniref:eukaryotic translation initiation factor 3 subunit L-like n=1 Tax=Dendronephthya gigantea TaxID=151771 RepID=UPI00106C3256|nr:eukaryotic translation initiation factor 3 subunit L-like [Dendronephthya gigantea]
MYTQAEEFVEAELDSGAIAGGYGYTGDEYGSHYQDGDMGQSSHSDAFYVTEEVQNFIKYFQKHVHEQNVREIHSMYESGFTRLSDEKFPKAPWPEADHIAPLVGNDPLFLTLYKELCFRHIYAKLKPTTEQRIDSYYNYCDLFNYILNTDDPVPLVLPNQWLWDIIDEFIYQFQSFSLFRYKFGKLGQDEITTLRDNPKIWNVHSVLNVLHSLVDKSRIYEQLEVYRTGGDPDTVAGEFGIRPLYKMLGYFSLIGLLRLHSLLGDYSMALRVLGNIELNRKSMYSRVPACQITTYYYVGFAYLMMRRYQDAIRSFCNILLYIQRAKPMIQNRAYQIDAIKKMNEKMYTLLAICLSLSPQRIDENVNAHLRETYNEKMIKLQRGDIGLLEEMFSFACPKFVTPSAPNYDAAPGKYHREAFDIQLKNFLQEMRQQSLIPIIRSYLKLYTTMPITKLAAFLDMDEETLRTQLLCYKHKQRHLTWTKGPDALEGEFQSSSDVDFYIENDMIHIADTKVERGYGNFFIRQIMKFEEAGQTVNAERY